MDNLRCRHDYDVAHAWSMRSSTCHVHVCQWTVTESSLSAVSTCLCLQILWSYRKMLYIKPNYFSWANLLWWIHVMSWNVKWVLISVDQWLMPWTRQCLHVYSLVLQPSSQGLSRLTQSSFPNFIWFGFPIRDQHLIF